jgi:hypothetical protein
MLHVLLLLLFLLPLPLIPMISKVNMIMKDEGKLTLSLNRDVMTPKVYEKFCTIVMTELPTGLKSMH